MEKPSAVIEITSSAIKLVTGFVVDDKPAVIYTRSIPASEFVKNGGTLVTTFWSGIVDENDLCFLGGFPGPLREVTGIWSEEIDSLYDNERNHMALDNISEMKDEYEIIDYCDLIHLETAEVLAKYKNDFYKGMPALTVNKYGNGKCYYIAGKAKDDFYLDFYKKLSKELNIKKVLETDLPTGVTAQIRENEKEKFIFLMNFNEESKVVDLENKEYINMLTKDKVSGKVELDKYGVIILKESI